MEAKHCDVLYYTEVHWISKENVLKRFLELKDQICGFMARKGKNSSSVQ
jgi:hypothetical protein